MKHPYTLVDGIEIDTKIAPLIKLIWDAGLKTYNSCEDNVPKGFVWIEFASVSDAEKFLNIVLKWETLKNSGDYMYNRAVKTWNSPDKKTNIKYWEFTPHLLDRNTTFQYTDDDLIETHKGPVDLQFTMSVRFPQTELPIIESRLKKHNKS